jgi:hypothetical protein
MFDQSTNAAPQGTHTSIYLEYGADEHDCDEQEFEICERGMHFKTRWQFALGTQLAVSFSYRDADGKMQRESTEGIIVDCERITCSCHRTTLLFLELPDSLRAVIRDSGLRLEASVANHNRLRNPQPDQSAG